MSTPPNRISSQRTMLFCIDSIVRTSALFTAVCFALLNVSAFATVDLQIGNEIVSGGNYAYISAGNPTGVAFGQTFGNGAGTSAQVHLSCDGFNPCVGVSHATAHTYVDATVFLEGGRSAIVEVTHSFSVAGYSTGGGGGAYSELPGVGTLGFDLPNTGFQTVTGTISASGNFSLSHHIGLIAVATGSTSGIPYESLTVLGAAGSFSVRSLTPGVEAILIPGGEIREEQEFCVIDTLVEIYPNALVGSESEKISFAKEAIKHANTILKQANIRLNDYGVLSGVTDGDIGADGRFTEQEIYAVLADGSALTMGGQNGITVVFADVPWAERPTVVGVAKKDSPTAIVKSSGDAFSTGKRIAHEVLHALGFQGDAPDGHSSNPADVMYHSEPVGSIITSQQVDQISSEPYLHNWSKCKQTHSPGLLGSQQKGARQDEIRDIVPGHGRHLDLDLASLNSTATDRFIHGRLVLADFFPSFGPVDATYVLDLELDSTNVGPDYALTLFVDRDASMQPLNVSAEVEDLRPGGSITSVSGAAIIDLMIFDGGANPLPVANGLTFSVDKSLLGIGSTLEAIPIRVVSKEGVVDADEIEFSLDMGWWLQQPELGLFQAEAPVGGTASFEVFRLTPNSSFNVFVDSELVVSGTTDGNGEYSGTFVAPVLGPTDDYFITVVDASGKSAFNIMQIRAIPGDFNGNGIVDTADYVVWRKSGGTQDDYNVWRANFGNMLVAGTTAISSDSPSAVPEPTANSMILSVALTIGCRTACRRVKKRVKRCEEPKDIGF